MGFITAIGPLAIDMYLPAFPAMAAELNTTTGYIERTLAGYLLGLAIAQLFYGPIADRYGRRTTLTLGLTIFIAASFGCAQSTSAPELTMWRIAQAFGGAACMVVPRAVIRDRFDTRDASRALSVLMLIMGATPILAPLIGAQVMKIAGWQWNFYVMCLVGGILLAFTLTTMQESLNKDHITPLRPGIIAKNYKQLASHKRFVFYTLSGGFGSAGMFSYIAGSPRVFIDVYGIDPDYFGLLFGANAAALIIMSQVSARLLNRFDPEQLLKGSQRTLVIATIIALMLTLANSLSLLLLMLCLLTFMGSQGFVNPNAAALALREQGHRLGAASALMGTLHMLCGAAAGMAISWWQTESALPLTTLLTICAVCSWLSGHIALKQKP